jgi:hypothetical protein
MKPSKKLIIYSKFGELAELYSAIETELGNIAIEGNMRDLLNNTASAQTFYDKMNRKTLGQLVKEADLREDILDKLLKIKEDRNFLIHHFFRVYGLNIFKGIPNSKNEQQMIKDLQQFHTRALEVFRDILIVTTKIDIFTY